MIDPITDEDFTAFVDGQLDPMRRLEVEAHLARHPEDAVRVMAELRDRDALRAAFAQGPGPMPERLHAAARRLDRSLALRRIGHRLRRAAVIALLVGAGWLAHSDIGFVGVPGTVAAPVDPVLVAEAREARRTAQLRARMVSQRMVASYDRAEIEAATGIRLPALPAAWQVRDVQVFPGRSGAGIEVAIDAGPHGEVALFATRDPSTERRPQAVTLAASEDGETAYWSDGRSAFLLSGGRDREDFKQAIAALAPTGP
jgi:anti-sigma factor RsiW